MSGNAVRNAAITCLTPSRPLPGRRIEFNKIKSHEIVDAIELTLIKDVLNPDKAMKWTWIRPGGRNKPGDAFRLAPTSILGINTSCICQHSVKQFRNAFAVAISVDLEHAIRNSDIRFGTR